MHEMSFAWARARPREGIRMASSSPMIDTTTSSSISVKAGRAAPGNLASLPVAWSRIGHVRGPGPYHPFGAWHWVVSEAQGLRPGLLSVAAALSCRGILTRRRHSGSRRDARFPCRAAAECPATGSEADGTRESETVAAFSMWRISGRGLDERPWRVGRPPMRQEGSRTPSIIQYRGCVCQERHGRASEYHVRGPCGSARIPLALPAGAGYKHRCTVHRSLYVQPG